MIEEPTTTEKPIILKKPIKVIFPRRKPSLVIPEKEIVYITPDKTTCAECDCFPKESPYQKPPILKPHQISPRTLYDLAATAVDNLWVPDAFDWSVEDVANWMEDELGFPQYRNCIIDNKIDGQRLLMLEDPSNLPKINIHNFDHIRIIVWYIRHEFSTEFIEFCRSIGLPSRLPLTHCTWFSSRTGPPWGIRRNWTRADILRWMKIVGPKPVQLDHWDLVWYQKPDFPKTMFARIPKAKLEELKWFVPTIENCNEYQTPRKFKTRPSDKEELIWMEHVPGSPSRKQPVQLIIKKEKKKEIPRESRLMRKKVNLEGLTGKDLLLARRLMPKQKFLA